MPETHDIKPCPGCGATIRKRSKLCARCNPRGGHTPEQRDQHALCGAKRKNGEPCRNFSGMGTDHFGYGTCRAHGGNSPAHVKSAAMIEVREQLATLGEPLPEDIRPQQQLLWLSRTIGGHVQKLLADPELADLTTDRGRAVFRLTMEQVDRAARLAKQCSEANVEQVEANIKQAQVENISRAVLGAAKDAGLAPKPIRALGAALRAWATTQSGDEAAAIQARDELAKLRAEIKADDERRIEQAAQKFSGLTFPPEEQLAPPTSSLQVRTDERGRRIYKRRSQSR